MIEGNKTDELIYRCIDEDLGKPLLEILVNKMKLSSRLIRKSKRTKNIFVNDRGGASVNMNMRNNDTIKVILDLEENQFEAEQMNIPILYEDLDMLVIDKEPYRVVHPTKRYQSSTIANGLAYIFNQRGINTKIRFINRLDRDTSGILLIAKNSYAQQIISNQMRDNTIKKKYIALLHGKLEKKEGTINLPIGRLNETDIKRSVIVDGQKSITHYKTLETFEKYTLVEIILETGRTHQIRVHFSHLGNPLVGDELYGGDAVIFPRQALHGIEITFKNVRTNEIINVISNIPRDISELLMSLRK